MPLKPAAYSHGPVAYSRKTDSTNASAKKLADGGAVDGTVTVCDKQCSGRGRQDRRWQMSAGLDLTFSLIVRDLGNRLDLLPLAAALAVSEACDDIAGTKSKIKWPNDVWVGGLKVAGILIEARPRNDWAVVGVGLNVNSQKRHYPLEIRESATSLLIEKGEEVGRGELLHCLLGKLHDEIEALRASETGTLLSNYRSRDALFGRSIAWVSGGVKHTGKAAGIDDSGSLLVKTSEGQITLNAGEVHLVGV